MLRWFGHVERMDKKRLIKEIYEADVGSNAAGRRRPRRTFLDQVGEVLEEAQVTSTRNRACTRNLMTVEEAKGVCVKIVVSGRK
jgi:hypothetical protein